MSLMEATQVAMTPPTRQTRSEDMVIVTRMRRVGWQRGR